MILLRRVDEIRHPLESRSAIQSHLHQEEEVGPGPGRHRLGEMMDTGGTIVGLHLLTGIDMNAGGKPVLYVVLQKLWSLVPVI